jgi:catechol 2,3-dioxygenase-like lactoylglutathione lyase family enzyme
MAVSFAFDHIHLRSRDPEATAAWFARMLGAQVLRSAPQGQPRIDLKLGGQDIFIAQTDDSVGPAPRSPHHGLDHFGLRVADLDAAAAALKAQGVTFTMEPREARPGVRIAFIEGPDAVCIELLERR